MQAEPEYSESISEEHADGVHDGENVKMTWYCLDCFNIVDGLVNDLLDEHFQR